MARQKGKRGGTNTAALAHRSYHQHTQREQMRAAHQPTAAEKAAYEIKASARDRKAERRARAWTGARA